MQFWLASKLNELLFSSTCPFNTTERHSPMVVRHAVQFSIKWRRCWVSILCKTKD